MPRAGFEPEWSKTVRALDSAAIGTNVILFNLHKFCSLPFMNQSI